MTPTVPLVSVAACCWVSTPSPAAPQREKASKSVLQAVGAALLPGRSLTRRLIWLAALWIMGALIATGMVLTSQFQESGLRRLGGVLNTTIDSVILATTASPTQARHALRTANTQTTAQV